MFVAFAALASCGGGGGGGGGGSGDFIGATGVGANGVTVFWWQYGGPNYGGGAAAIETADGAFVAAGQRSRAGDSFDVATYDACLSKIDARGKVIWERTFGNPTGWDYAEDVEPTADGGFVLVGATTSAAGDLDLYVVKTAADGTLEWERSIGQGWLDDGRAVCETADGYAVVGNRTRLTPGGVNTDGALIRLDDTGATISETFLGGASLDTFLDVQNTAAGGLIVAGVWDDLAGSPNHQLWLAEFGAAGNLDWQRTFGIGRATSVAQTGDGGFVVTGSVEDPGGKHDCLLLRLDGAGFEQWRRPYGGPDDDGGESVWIADSGEILVAGSTTSFTTGAATWERQDMYLAKYTANGAFVWQKVKGRWPTSSELALSIRETADGGMLVCGGGGAHMVVMKADANGDTVVLGDLDVSLNIPDVPQGIINFYNEVEVGQHAVLSLMTPRGVGPFVADMTARLLSGDTSLDICDQGGSLTVTPPLVPPLAVGQHFELQFASCAGNPSNPFTLVGGYWMDVDALTGTPTTTPYQLGTTLTIDLGVTDDVGTTYVEGYLRCARAASSATDFQDQTDLVPGEALFLRRGYRTSLATELSIASRRSGATFTLGPAHVLAVASYLAEPLTIDVVLGQELRGPVQDAPSSGSLTVLALDQSSLRIRAVGNSEVELDLDTDGDGTIDLTRRMLWEDLD